MFLVVSKISWLCDWILNIGHRKFVAKLNYILQAYKRVSFSDVYIIIYVIFYFQLCNFNKLQFLYST